MRQRQLYIKNFGDLVNTAAPIHVKQDSLVHNVLAKFVTMPGEKEEYTARGSVLMGGVKLHQSFAATGYSDKTRYFRILGLGFTLWRSTRKNFRLDVNVKAVHYLTKSVVKKMEKQYGGYILNVASSAGMLPAGPFMTTYYATKAYAASFTRAVERNV